VTLSRQLAAPVGQLVAFVGGAAVCIVAAVAAAGFFLGFLGPVRQDVAGATVSAFIAALLIALSVYLLRRQGASLASLGLPTIRGRVPELAFGFVVSAAMFLAVAWTQSIVTGSPWEFQGTAGLVAAVYGLALTTCFVLAEELLFRGVGLRALRGLFGPSAAVVLSAVLFGAYHLVGSGDWAMGAFFRFFTAMLGGLLFGYAAVRSGGLALPIGLHLGGNWVQASVAGFSPVGAVGGSEQVRALWRIPLLETDVQLLTAPDLLVRLPYITAIGIAALLTWHFLRFKQRSRY